jgi:hypothetical protein
VFFICIRIFSAFSLAGKMRFLNEDKKQSGWNVFFLTLSIKILSISKKNCFFDAHTRCAENSAAIQDDLFYARLSPASFTKLA